MSNNEINKFNNIIDEMIQKSHLTHRQLEIILNKKKIMYSHINITSGAYYRQIKQIKIKLYKMHYTLIVLFYFGIINDEKINNISKLSKQLSKIKYTNKNIVNDNKIISVINQFIDQLNLV